MNAELEATTIERVIELATPAQRRRIVQELLAKEAAETQCLPILIKDPSGKYVGYFMPEFKSTVAQPPESTLAKHKEIHRNLDLQSLDDAITWDEMRKRLGLPEVRLKKL